MPNSASIHTYVEGITYKNKGILPPHPNIVLKQPQGKYQPDDQSFNAITTFSTDSLETRLPGLKQEQKNIIMLQLSRAVHHIHSHHKAHGMITAENIYFSKESGKAVLMYPGRMASLTPESKTKDIKDLKNVLLSLADENQQMESNIKDWNAGTTAENVLQDPLFWSVERKLSFLSKITNSTNDSSKTPDKRLKLEINEKSADILGESNWQEKLKVLQEEELEEYKANLQNKFPNKKFWSEAMYKKSVESRGKYEGTELQSLLRFIRNRWVHYWEDNKHIHACFAFDHLDGFWKFFTKRFPELFIVVYNVVKEHSKFLTGITDEYMDRLA